jgi:hypothetical protein
LTTASTSDVNNIILSPQSIWIAASSQSGGGGGGNPSLPFKSIQFNNSGSFGGSSKYIFETSPVFNGSPAPANSLAIQLESSNNSFTTQTIRSLNNGSLSLANIFMQNGTGTSGIQQGVLLFNSAWGGNTYIRNSSIYSLVASDLGNTNAAKQLFFIASSNANSQFEWHYNTSNTLQSNSRLMSLASNGRFNLAKYGINTFAGTPAYSLGVDASGNVIEFVGGGGGGNANITTITSSALATLESSSTLDLTTLYIVTDYTYFLLMCKAEAVNRLGKTAQIVDYTYSGEVYYDVQTNSIINGSIYDVDRNIWNSLLPVDTTFGTGCVANTFHQSSLGNVLGNLCVDNTFYQDASSNVFGDDCSFNIFKQEAYSNVFGDNCTHNTFEQGTNSNILDYQCSYNTFEQGANLNTLGINCSYNTFEKGTNSNILGNTCGANTFKKIANSNTLLDSCNYNVFDIASSNNSIGNNGEGNIIGMYCQNIILLDNCLYNIFEQFASDNQLGSFCGGNTFRQESNSNILGSGCLYNTFNQISVGNTLGNDCAYNTFGQAASSNALGDNCNNNTFGQNASTNILGDSCNNNTFGQGVNGFIFSANLLNVTIEGTPAGLDLTPIGYAFIYGNTGPAVIRYDYGTGQWYHQYYDTTTPGFITTNL